MKGIGSGRYLSFEIDGNQYAVEVERVEVVLETVPITRVPKAPSHLKGVINYRGAVVPVADLRDRFRGEVEKATASPPGEAAQAQAEAGGGTSSIIVLQIHFGDDDIVMGILADAVREVVDIDPSHIEKAPGLGGKGGSGLIAGIGEKDGQFVVILDIDAAFGDELFQAKEARVDKKRQAEEVQ